ncbi:F-box/kelch-repeat protein At3g06240-like [Papaver somniferum]|uniref:F-box/kelch-repeat protein At3g06240-like n=1 Tax=Papaver somniferum TaxID=3469 RepID=UPI000E6F70D3|nr:F-box/kelch-repeat protein At3g06240-like [Papaver somniferum]
MYDNSVEVEQPFSVCELVLWNPATAEYKTVPAPPNKQAGGVPIFGYDYKIDDYIFVLISYERLVMAVYTLRSNSWKSIEVGPGDGVFVNGTCHWLVGTRDNSKVIVSLDISNEKFVELQLPKEPLENNHLLRNVWVLEGCLSVVNAIGVHSEIWVMQTYGVRESWTKRCVITHSRIIKEMYYLRSMWDFKNGEILLMSGSNLVLFDAISGEPRRLGKMLKGIENYVESLVSLNSGTYVKKRVNTKRKINGRTI